MNRNFAIIICSVFLLFISCKNETLKDQSDFESVYRDLAAIKKEGTLKALVVYNSTSYFLYRGKPMGFEYDLLEKFADYLDVELEVKISKNIDSLFNELNTSDIDIVAYGLAITTERKKEVNFSDHLYLTHQVLVQKKPDNWRSMKWSTLQKSLVKNVVELINDTISMRKKSSFMERTINLSKELGGPIYIDTLAGYFSTDEIIKMVVDGKIKYTIADKNIATVNQFYYPILDIDIPISFSQRISWAQKPNAPELTGAINQWLKTIKKKKDYNIIYNKYFKNKRSFKRRIKSEFFSLNDNKISKYDDIIKKHAKKIDWDWRLLSALIYQESRFEPEATSWAEAKGLMQLMPETAKELGVTDRLLPESSIYGGTKYLKQLWNNFEKIQDSTQRLKFTMASYNSGLGHVLDAQRMAEKKNLDRNLWDDNVENMILSLSYPKNYNEPYIKYGYVRGIEPYNYVKQIFERFEHYERFIK
jgi:membrane-bound lytic murein transglycosylase F